MYGGTVRVTCHEQEHNARQKLNFELFLAQVKTKNKSNHLRWNLLPQSESFPAHSLLVFMIIVSIERWYLLQPYHTLEFLSFKWIVCMSICFTELVHNWIRKLYLRFFKSFNPTGVGFDNEGLESCVNTSGQVMQTTTAYPDLCHIKWYWEVLLPLDGMPVEAVAGLAPSIKCT